MTPGATDLRGVIFDWGGVLTPSMDGALADWARQDGADVDHFRTVLGTWVRPTFPPGVAGTADLEDAHGNDPHGDSPVHRLERGEIDVAEFEQLLAAELDVLGSTVPAPGLLTRMLSGLSDLDERMLGLIRRLRSVGFSTALLSNSWGDHYPERLWQGLFDSIVISGRVGMRKPEPRIYRHTADRLGLTPDRCVMIDDLPGNIIAAAGVGMVGIVHVSWDETLFELETVLGVELGGAA
jgi:epoxide hydrolase-like predicted phosphatase